MFERTCKLKIDDNKIVFTLRETYMFLYVSLAEIFYVAQAFIVL